MHIPTAARYFGKSFLHPSRAVRNGIRVLKFALLDPEVERRRLFDFLALSFGVDGERLKREFDASDFARWTAARRRALEVFPGPYRFGSTGEWDCEALYYVVRALKPRSVVETGVCYGASTSYILEALKRNGGGHLYSIDLGNTAEEPPNDFFVHPSQQKFWTLIVGDSKRELPDLLQRVGTIDHFHHDSLHTYEHMMWEYETAAAHLSPGGAISSDDVNVILKLREPFRHSPFRDFCERRGWDWQAARNFGLTVNAAPEASHIRAVNGVRRNRFDLSHGGMMGPAP